MPYKYLLTDTARKDLAEILEYISLDLANVEAAKSLINKLEKNLEKICSFPETCPLAKNEYIPDLGIRKFVLGNYVLYYLPKPQTCTIIILRIVYGGRNVEVI